MPVQYRVDDVVVLGRVVIDTEPIAVARKRGVGGQPQRHRPQVADQFSFDILDIACHRIVVFHDDPRIAVGLVQAVRDRNAVVRPAGRLDVAPERSDLQEGGLAGVLGLRIHQIDHPLGQERAHVQRVHPRLHKGTLAPAQPLVPVRVAGGMSTRLPRNRPQDVGVQFIDAWVGALEFPYHRHVGVAGDAGNALQVGRAGIAADFHVLEPVIRELRLPDLSASVPLTMYVSAARAFRRIIVYRVPSGLSIPAAHCHLVPAWPLTFNRTQPAMFWPRLKM